MLRSIQSIQLKSVRCYSYSVSGALYRIFFSRMHSKSTTSLALFYFSFFVSLYHFVHVILYCECVCISAILPQSTGIFRVICCLWAVCIVNLRWLHRIFQSVILSRTDYIATWIHHDRQEKLHASHAFIT